MRSLEEYVGMLAGRSLPGPAGDPVSRPYFEAAVGDRLRLMGCMDCALTFHYPREICPRCWGSRIRWQDASGDAAVVTSTEVWKPGHPAWRELVPYRIAIVRLAEGPTMLTQLLCEPGVVPRPNDPCHVTFVTVGNTRLPFFQINGREL